ncbi:hypothetical protein [Mesobacillus subterraneus]|uniref:Uncharacterized protein n=1 Tax=Mesobacillus subterraneus TaxID=285983 RepID=A0A3R9EXT5_9BACI|nr:hypothetical protein [Mesobacillus subterraneus]RSD25538.1 hypothetical protein EJA10_17180 [Mesobacillus subterraneus]
MNKHSEEQWELLKNVSPGEAVKIKMRNKILSSIRNQLSSKRKNPIFELKHILLTTMFILISAGLLVQLQSITPQTSRSPGGSLAENQEAFTTELDSVLVEETEDGFAFYKDGAQLQVGAANYVTAEQKEKIINSQAMYVEKKLEDFPYSTTLYIEHIKMMEVSLRYHFFVEAGKNTMHFSFDYPKLEYAEIFQFIATLDFHEPRPFKHEGTLYVTHGYGDLPFPVGLRPIEITNLTEKYEWEEMNPDSLRDYIEKIKSTPEWKQAEGGGSSYTFISTDGNIVVSITKEGKEINYEFTYLNRDE